MVKGTIETRDGVHRIECNGHATGSEQVCAAISALMYALAGFLGNQPNAYTAIIGCKIESGHSEIVFIGYDEAFEVVRIGLLQLAKSYPEYLKITEKEG
jgi:uncharacterized protein YsxB (DUF464 family)